MTSTNGGVSVSGEGAERAIVLHPYRKQGARRTRSAEACLEEAVGLAQAIALDVVGSETVAIVRPRPATLFGTGTVKTIGDQCVVASANTP